MLDEFGLLGALRNLNLAADGLVLLVEAPEPLPPLSAAVEVAAYRVAAEAKATRCQILLGVDEAALTLTVTDDGRGIPKAFVPGVGVSAMRERAAELGGSVTITPAAAGGTRVQAILSCRGSP